MKKRIKLFDVSAGKPEEQAVLKTLRSNFWASGAGEGNVARFEEEFNKYIGSQFCVSLNSGTAALHLAMSLYDLQGKEVIMPSLSFVSTAHSALYNGAKPVFVDVDPKTLCLDPQKVNEKITNDTGAILPVHFGGMPCDVSNLIKICKSNRIPIIEDAAHAAGARYDKKKIGGHGNVTCFSFHPVKNLAMPTGGAICINGKMANKKTKELLMSLRWCGISNRKGPKYDVPNLGWNFYMNEFSAAIGLIQLKKLDSENNKRKKIAKRYHKEISAKYKMPFDSNCSYHLYWVLVDDRDNFMKQMEKAGIQTGIHYLPIHNMTAYRKKSQSRLPVTEKVGKEIVTLPMHPNLSEYDVNYIIKNVNRLL